MKGILGRKVGMTQIFDGEGNRVPVTVVNCAGNIVLQKKTTDGADGYNAVKIGFDDAHKQVKEGTEPRYRLSKAEVGVFQKAGIETPKRTIREIRVTPKDLEELEVGGAINATVFAAGDFVDATATCKGRGFTGVMKRHNFRGTKASHGVHEFFRHGGSIGCSAYPARVFPGKKMAGQHGNTRTTVQNLTVIEVLEEDNAILVRGSIPGPNGGLVMLRSAVKKLIE